MFFVFFMIFIAGLAPDYVRLCAKITLNSHRCYKKENSFVQGKNKTGAKSICAYVGPFLTVHPDFASSGGAS
jgi:hypothetical protein